MSFFPHSFLYFLGFHRETNINDIVQLKQTEIPYFLKDNVIEVNQRSDEWIELLKFYRCGTNNCNNTPLIDLLRGAIMESVVLQGDFNSIVKATPLMVGLLVKEKNVYQSVGCAPDLLLHAENDKIIPVEIKCISHNSKRNYYRSVTLAKRQLKKANSRYGYGMLIFTTWKNNSWTYHYTYVALDS